ncbi:unnamed protein product [Onchocerca flexuosa]|uniref:Uncharacterized protein n=1 Tax=Onchocerca flexuosa TaxID=387005 RepID=A0A183HZJ4_9BILA|nr:unnamed protein product [Onchocerca flexuosa]
MSTLQNGLWGLHQESVKLKGGRGNGGKGGGLFRHQLTHLPSHTSIEQCGREREEGSFPSSPPSSISCKDGIDGTDGWMGL